MSLKVKEIKQESLRLPASDRAKLAEYLINSLDEVEDEDTEKLWVEEAERRYKEYKKGKLEAKSAELVFKDARSRIE